MNREEIMAVIRSLASSQGSYGRLLRRIEELKENDPDKYETVMAELEAQNFKDAVDLILYIET